MKKIIIVMLFLASLISEKGMSQVIVDISTFHSALDPYGQWINDPTYGNVWVANEPGFRPYYSGGHWVYTDQGWTWVSDYDWGWAPFHYGRWAYLDNGEWGWVPGYEWAPAWVSWSGGDDYYGWAPLGPGLSVDIAFNSIPANRWCFVQSRYMYSTSLHSHFINAGRNEDIYRHVTAINNVHVSNNIRYVAGPKREDVERQTHQTITPRTISYSAKPGRAVVGAHGVNIYRPEANKAPARVNTPPARANTPVSRNNFNAANPRTAHHNNTQTQTLQPVRQAPQQMNNNQRAAGVEHQHIQNVQRPAQPVQQVRMQPQEPQHIQQQPQQEQHKQREQQPQQHVQQQPQQHIQQQQQPMRQQPEMHMQPQSNEPHAMPMQQQHMQGGGNEHGGGGNEHGGGGERKR